MTKPAQFRVDRFESALLNRAVHAIGQAEGAWQRFVGPFEALAMQHDNTEARALARDIAQKLQQCRQVLEGFVEE